MPIKNAHHDKLDKYFLYKSESEAIKIYKWPWSKLTLWKFSRPIYASFKRLLIFERRKSSCTAKKIQRVESVLYFIRKYCQNSITFAIPLDLHIIFFFFWNYIFLSKAWFYYWDYKETHGNQSNHNTLI